MEALAVEQHGIDGLRLNYKGKKSYLSAEQREEVLSWLQTKDTWEIGELEYKMEVRIKSYNIRSSSRAL